MASPPTDGASDTRGSAASSSSSRGLQLPKGGKNTSITTHVAFVDPLNALAGYKINSNRIHAEGGLMPIACSSCLTAVSNFKKSLYVGRGSSVFNEYFCCMSSPSLGVGGTQCGRCVGLGSGASNCFPPPDTLLPDARALIKLLPAYNKALSANKNTLFRDMPAGDQSAIEAAVVASKSFFEKLQGAYRSGAASTPSKKRKAGGDAALNSELVDMSQALTQSSTDIRQDVRSLQLAVGTVNKQLTSARSEVAELRRYARNARERERWQVKALQRLLADSDTDHSDLPAFDLAAAGFESEDGEASSGEEEAD